MTLITNSTALSTDDVRALRQASTVSFHTDGSGSWIRTSFDDTRGATRTQADLFPERDGGDRYRDIRIAEADTATEDFYAFTMVHTAQYSRTFQSITRILRKGDRLGFRWGRDVNTNGYLEDANLHGDQFDICIYRGKAVNDPLVFTVENSTTPDNTSRMIRTTRGF